MTKNEPLIIRKKLWRINELIRIKSSHREYKKVTKNKNKAIENWNEVIENKNKTVENKKKKNCALVKKRFWNKETVVKPDRK